MIRGEHRASAFWGKGSRGETKNSALWGRRGGRGLVFLACAIVFVLPLSAAAGSPRVPITGGAFIDPTLLTDLAKNPGGKVDVIIQSSGGMDAAASAARQAGNSGSLKKLGLVGAVSATIPAARLNSLAKVPGLIVTADAPMKLAGGAAAAGLSNGQIGPYESGNAKLWPTPTAPGPKLPAIAIVDSGIDATKAADFGTRIVASVNLSSSTPNAVGDGRGHGTFVAGIAAGSAPGYAGAAPSAPIVSLRVMDDHGMAYTSDVIAACQWILANKDKYNIRVANFSMHASRPSHFVTDPLDRAVEKLWFGGVTVTVASGNYGIAGSPVRVGFAPGNDPFVITVGAADIGGSVGIGNDVAAPFSAYGYTYDGFSKPEIAAPGRYMVGPIPAGSTLAAEKAANITAPGYIQLSGTSFSAPVAAGTAAVILARHPAWTPDQVKGALMATADLVPKARNGSMGLGELSASKAAAMATPPNPNKTLESFLVPDQSGGLLPVFDWATWERVAASNPAWNASNWTDLAWASSNWTDSNWVDSNWTDSNWTDSNWVDSNWASSNWTDSATEDAAEGDANLDGGYMVTDAELLAILADPNLAPGDPANLPDVIAPAPDLTAPTVDLTAAAPVAIAPTP